MDAVTMATKEDAAGSLSCFFCAAAVMAAVVSAVSEMDAAITAAVPLSGSYLFCAAAETVSRNYLFPSHIGGQNACFALLQYI